MSYLPSTQLGLDSWAANFASYISTNFAAVGLLTGQQAAYLLVQEAFSDALSVSNTPSSRTPVTVQATKDAEILLRSETQALVEQVQAFPGTTNEARESMAITVRLTTRTPVPVPTAVPVLAVHVLNPLETTLRIRTLGSDSNRFPANVVGCNIYCKKGTTAPTSISECVFVGRATKRFFTQFFEIADAGENCFYLAQYVTRTDLVGPSSALLSTTIVG